MNRIISIITIMITIAAVAYSQTNKGISFSGIFESSVSANAGTDSTKHASYGLEEYANIRAQSRIGENVTFFGAINLIAATGDHALAMLADTASMGAVSSGNNYAAAIELERLYFKIKGGALDFDGGLMRLPFGYGQVWRPSDFLNPPNPLKPDARPRAVVGGSAVYYPVDELKVQTFAATGRDPLSNNSGLAGVSADWHFDKASVQLLYAAERSETFPSTPSSLWTHRVGASVKADVEVGLLMDMLYAYNNDMEDEIDGLSFSAGADYSLAGGRLVVLAEYLHNGAASSTSIAGGGAFTNENYLYAGGTWRFSDFTNVGVALVSDIDDVSFVPMLTFSSEVFHGAVFSVMAQAPIDNDDSYFYIETKLKLKF